jgi:hypothetical protein
MFHYYHTVDIKLAACLDSLGVPFRKSDPVTRVLQNKNGRDFEQCTYWFDTTDEALRKLCAALVEAYDIAKPLFQWKRDVRLNRADPLKPPQGDHYKLGEDHILYDRMDVLILREVWMDWTRNGADLRKIIEQGDKKVNISVHASQKTKDLIKKYI